MRVAIGTVSIAVVSAVLLTGCPGGGKGYEKSQRDQPIRLQVVGSPPRLEVNEPPTPGCNQSNPVFDRGCVIAELNEEVTMEFTLQQGNNYYLRTFQVCSGIDKPASPSDCTLAGPQQSEFEVFVGGVSKGNPDAQGNVMLGDAAADVEDFSVVNYNNVALDYFYSVQACPDGSNDESECFWTDPPVINKGVGQR